MELQLINVEEVIQLENYILAINTLIEKRIDQKTLLKVLFQLTHFSIDELLVEGAMLRSIRNSKNYRPQYAYNLIIDLKNIPTLFWKLC